MKLLLKSMTGYGRGEFHAQKYDFTVEMKSVNHRFCEVVVRIPRSFHILEEKIRKVIQEDISRGRIEVFVTIEESSEKEKNIKVDKGLALSYYNALKEINVSLNLEEKIGLSLLAKFPEVIKLEEKIEDLEAIWQGLSGALGLALEKFKESRAAEGSRLQNDIAARLQVLDEMVKEIEQLAPLVVENYAQRLHNRLQEFLQAGEVDETRMTMEIALLADRSNITEELVRLNSHLEQFQSLLQTEHSVGRQLDFMVQEINREVNTIGSKANDYKIAHQVINIKSEIEKIREQIQNIE